MATVVDELVTILGIKLATDAMSNLLGFQKGVMGVTKTLTALGVVVTGAATTAGMFINRTLTQANELDKLSESMGLSTDSLQEWSYAVQRVGGDAKSVQGDLDMLRKKFMTTGENAEKMLTNMADSFSKMSLAQAQTRGRFFGLSEDTVRLLHRGKEGVEELRKEAHKLGGIIPADAIKRAAEFKRSLAELQFAIRGITSQVAIATVPALEKIVTSIKEFIALNREWISLGLEAIFRGLVDGVERFFNLVSNGASLFKPLIAALREFMPEMEGAEFVMHLVTGALTGLVLVFAPLLAKMAGLSLLVTAIAFAFEDLFTYLEGGESAIGFFFDAFEQRWPNLASLLKRIGSWIKEYVVDNLTLAKDIALVVADAFVFLATNILDSLDTLAAPLANFFDTFKNKFPALAAALKAFAEVIKTGLIGAFELLVAALKKATDAIFTILEGVGFGIGKVAEFGDWLATKFNFGEGASKALAQAGGVTTTNSSNASTYNDNKAVTIQLATNDPQQAAEQIYKALQQSNVNTPGQFAPVTQ